LRTSTSLENAPSGLLLLLPGPWLTWEFWVGPQVSFLVTIHDDSELEGDEQFALYLNEETGGAVLGPQNVAIVTIADNDANKTSPWRYGHPSNLLAARHWLAEEREERGPPVTGDRTSV
jgi:hypothetical protein